MSLYQIEAGTAQHIGDRARQNDRTALFGGARAPGYMMAVLADGISGGSLASEQALHTSKQLFDEFSAGDVPDLQLVADLLRAIIDEVHTIIKMNPIAAHSEPQTTLVLLVLTPAGQAIWAHVGDSRLYLFSNSQCALRTSDATYVEHLIHSDKLAPAAARKHRHSKLLNNSVGGHLKQPVLCIGTREDLQAGDAFLLCSDGLWQFFTDAELAAVIAKNTPRQAAEMLINKARERAAGRGDNCSMAIVKLVKPRAAAPAYTVQKMGSAV